MGRQKSSPKGHQKKAAAPPPSDVGQRINAALKAGRLDEARRLLETMVAAGQATPQVLHFLGEVLYNLGETEAAEKRLKQALNSAPDFVPALFALGLLSVKQGRFTQALTPLEKAVNLEPNHEGAHFNLATARENIGDTDAARESYAKVLALNPQNGRALNNLAGILEKDGDEDAALAHFTRAVQVEPHLAAAWNNVARLAEKLQKHDVAEQAHRQILGAGLGEQVTVTVAAAEFLVRRSRPGDAETLLRKTLEGHPDAAPLMAALAFALTERGKHDDAVQAAERAVELDPTLADAYAHLGTALNRLNAWDRAADAFLKGVSHAERPRAFYREAAAARRSDKKLGEALPLMLRAALPEAALRETPEAVAEKVLETGALPDWVLDEIRALPDHGEAQPALVTLATFFAGLGRHAEMHRIFQAVDPESRKTVGTWSAYAFTANYDPDLTAEDLFAHYLTYKDLVDLPDAAPAAPPTVTTREKLKIGYLSPDFRSHAMINFILPILQNHDRDAVEIHAYAELQLGDKKTREVEDIVDGWRLTTRVTDKDVAAMARADGIDIMVDLAGHTSNNRLAVFPHRPAPVTATWLGYLYTTAVPGVDYFIGDAISSPPESAHLFSEALVRLPHYLACFRPHLNAPDEIAPLPADANGYVTFGNCSRPVRINPAVLRAWAEILAGAPTARLRLDHPDYGDPWSVAFMRNRAAEAGLPLDRVDILHGGDYWRFYSHVDVVLDTFPHASGTTTCEAMYMGVPVLAIADRPPVGRLGAAMVDTVGYPEWIGWNVAEYVRKAVRMAGEIDGLRAIRGTLRDDLMASAICDGSRFVRNLEEAYRMMWRNACDGVRTPINVPDLSRRAATVRHPKPAPEPAAAV